MTTHGGGLVGEGGSACAASGFLLPQTSCGMEWKPYLRVYIHKMVQTRLPRDQRPTKPVSRPVANTRCCIRCLSWYTTPCHCLQYTTACRTPRSVVTLKEY